jgi:hypothetical protein
MWCVVMGKSEEKRHRCRWEDKHIDPLLGNDSVNIFPPEPTRAKIGCLLLGNGAVNTARQQQRLCFLRGPCR